MEINFSLNLGDILALLISSVALFITGRTYFLSKRKTNEDVIFQERVVAYKRISLKIHLIHEMLFQLQQKMQAFEGNEKQWEEYLLKNCGEHYSAIGELEDIFYEHVTILPSDYTFKLNELILTLRGRVTNYFHFDNDLVIDRLDSFSEEFTEVVNYFRESLHIQILEKTLARRINRNY